jgi:hypothetical protein
MTLVTAKRGGSGPMPVEVSEIDVLWITAGLSCDGDTISVTAATQPSIEDLILGALPWISKIRLHNPFLAYENVDEFVRSFRDAAEGKLAPFRRTSIGLRRKRSITRYGTENPDISSFAWPAETIRRRFRLRMTVKDSQRTR